MLAEFDNYADAYAELVKDPIRARFAANPPFFDTRKVLLTYGTFFGVARSTRGRCPGSKARNQSVGRID